MEAGHDPGGGEEDQDEDLVGDALRRVVEAAGCQVTLGGEPDPCR